MATKKLDSRKHSNKTDDFIQDYLSDVWGSTAESNLDVDPSENNTELLTELSTHLPNKEQQLSESMVTVQDSAQSTVSERIQNTISISPKYSLIPTIKLHKHNEAQAIRSQVDYMIILLTNLYFLRRPLSPKLRQFILDLSEQAIDDFNAAYWLQLPPLVGAKNEV
jgi:hypothetical protein